jgi:hypothetical protein
VSTSTQTMAGSASILPAVPAVMRAMMAAVSCPGLGTTIQVCLSSSHE